MSIYAIGDIQGCFKPFQALLNKIQFDPQHDELWVAGDLVNRGPDNLAVLRTVKQFGSAAKVVLGNHDLHLLAVRAGHRQPTPKDTFQDVLTAPDADELMDWLQQQPLLIQNEKYVLTHAGVPNIWSIEKASDLAEEVHQVLISDQANAFFATMYGNQPSVWAEQLEGTDRLRVITNYFTRMRFTSKSGQLDMETKEGAEHNPPGMKPWFEHPRPKENKSFLFGHWAALEGKTGKTGFHALDTGCVWGGCLRLLRLDDMQTFHTKCS